MSKLICCDLCGTIYDPKKGCCPTCGSKPSSQDAALFSDPAPIGDTFSDDFFSGLEIETSFGDDEEDTTLPEDPAVTLTEKPEPSLAGDNASAADISSIWGTASKGASKAESTVSAADPESTATVAPVRKKSAPSRTAPRSSAVSQPGTVSVSRSTTPEKNSAAAPAEDDEAAMSQRERAGKKRRETCPTTGKDKIVCVVLATLVVLFALFILYRFLRPGFGGTETADTQASTVETTVETEAEIRCTAVKLSADLRLSSIGETQTLTVILEPAGTTELPLFSSSDPSVATVDENGIITAVAEGKAQITVTCGSATASCTVTCAIVPPETTAATDATEPPTEEDTEPTDPKPAALELNRTDITFFSKGESFRLRAGEYDSLVTWRSGNTAVATVKNGKVTAVGSGTTRIYATYGGQEVSCIIRCSFKSSTTTVPPDGGDTEPSETTAPTDATGTTDPPETTGAPEETKPSETTTPTVDSPPTEETQKPGTSGETP